jgi:hypothetical protein
MNIVKSAVFVCLVCIAASAVAEWEAWEETETFMGYWNVPEGGQDGYLERWFFVASADYTRFSNPLIEDVPIIPVTDMTAYPEGNTDYSVNRLLYGEAGAPTIDYVDHDPEGLNPYSFFATCTYTVGLTEHCAGLVVRCVGQYDFLTSRPVSIPDDPEEEMNWIGSFEPFDLGENESIPSCDVAGDDFGNVHLVTAESPWRIYSGPSAPPRNPDWTTQLYYWRWHIDDEYNMGWNIEELQLTTGSLTIHRNPDLACDSDGNLHIVYSFNDDAGTSDYGLGYCKITFDIYGEINTITHSVIMPDGTGVMYESPDITLDDGDNPHVVFQHDGGLSNNWNVYYTTKLPVSGWSIPTQLPPPPSVCLYCWEPSIAICHDYVHVVYCGAIPSDIGTYTTTNDRIYYTNRPLTAQQFSSAVVLSEDADYHQGYEWGWGELFVGQYANWNHYPCVIAGDDEISVVWQGEGKQYGKGIAPLTRRRCWVEE